MTIAGSDTCGGAGIQADLKTITSLGAHGMSVITAVTAQNSLGIMGIQEISAEFISKQIESVIEDIDPDAVKIGMLLTNGAVRSVAACIEKHKLSPVVLDPVMRASTGTGLLEPEALRLLKEILLPRTNVLTPNLKEAESLSGMRVTSVEEMEAAAKVIRDLGPDVVVTGGHLKGKSVDVLYDGKKFYHFPSERVDTEHTHGSGCVFSAALATFLAKGDDLPTATKLAQNFTRVAIKTGYPCGRGGGVVNPNPVS